VPILTRDRPSPPRRKSGRIGRAWLFYTFARVFFRVKRDRVLVLSDSRSEITGNLEFIVRELRQKHPELEVPVVLRENLSAERSRRDAFRLPFLIATSKFIIVDDFYPYIYRLKLRRGVHLIQAWHAAGAFKRVGYSRLGLPGGPSAGSIVHRGYTDTITSSEAIRRDYAEAFWMPIEDVHAIGVPRTDMFFDTELVASTGAAIRERYGIRPEQKVVLFAPTFRGNGQKVAHYDFDLVDWAALAAALGDDAVMLVKIHPFVRDIPAVFEKHPQFIDVSAEREINELLFATDVLVTDYSSVIFEFALLRRPIVFHVPDLEEYQGARDFYYPFSYYLCGPTTRTTEELIAAIGAAELDTARLDAFVDYFMSACDGHSTERFVQKLIIDRLDEPASARPKVHWPPSSFAGIPGWSTAPSIPAGHSRLGRLWLRLRRAIRRERRPDLVSVIMPAYNVEGLVEQSVRSVLDQSHKNIELIVVDDSSTDGTPAVLARLASADSRMRVYRRPNGGPNAARNFAIGKAHGQFLTFLDADDLALPGAYADMVASLKKTKSDFVVGSYVRLRGTETEPPRTWIVNAHKVDRSYVGPYRGILVNAVQWSKMYYRSFWDDYVKRFSVPGFYQDQLVSARAFGRARYIDVLSRPVVAWRLREDASSMTQQLGTVANLKDRFRTSIEAVDILRENAGPRMADARLLQLMRFDFGTTIARLTAADDAYWAALVTGIRDLAQRSRDVRVWDQISAQHRVLFFLIEQDRRADAVAFIEAGGRYPERFEQEERDGRLYLHLPFWDDPTVPEDLFIATELQRELLAASSAEDDANAAG
jgi:CDP-glycerol glycerophosphotransferase (TagB/SpsB family)/glycosyltransferase involved in cell wall biosynthesis